MFVYAASFNLAAADQLSLLSPSPQENKVYSLWPLRICSTRQRGRRRRIAPDLSLGQVEVDEGAKEQSAVPVV